VVVKMSVYILLKTEKIWAFKTMKLGVFILLYVIVVHPVIEII